MLRQNEEQHIFKTAKPFTVLAIEEGYMLQVLTVQDPREASKTTSLTDNNDHRTGIIPKVTTGIAAHPQTPTPEGPSPSAEETAGAREFNCPQLGIQEGDQRQEHIPTSSNKMDATRMNVSQINVDINGPFNGIKLAIAVDTDTLLAATKCVIILARTKDYCTSLLNMAFALPAF